jgi:hypothetical protein
MAHAFLAIDALFGEEAKGRLTSLRAEGPAAFRLERGRLLWERR